MMQTTFTIDLELIITILSVAVIAISGWAIIYFSVKIVLNFYIKSNLGDMPTADEISELYRQNNEAIQKHLIPLDILLAALTAEDRETHVD